MGHERLAAGIRKNVSMRVKRINISSGPIYCGFSPDLSNLSIKKLFYIREVVAEGVSYSAIKVLSRAYCIKDDKSESLDATAISCMLNYLEIALPRTDSYEQICRLFLLL